MKRALAPAEVPAAAWSHLQALPDLYRQRDLLQGYFSQRHCQTARYFLKRARLQHFTRETLQHEAALVRLGIAPENIPALLAPATPARHEPAHHETEH